MAQNHEKLYFIIILIRPRAKLEQIFNLLCKIVCQSLWTVTSLYEHEVDVGVFVVYDAAQLVAGAFGCSHLNCNIPTW